MKKIFILLSIFLFIPKISATDLTPNSKSAILMEYSTGKVLYQKNIHEKLAPASMTKIMTLLLVMETIYEGNLDYTDEVHISDNAQSMGGSQLFLESGTKLTVNELLKGVSIASANDASVALAEKIGGTEEEFVKMMNAKVASLGLKNTQFKNAHGLDEEGHYSTAHDMSIIAKELIKYETILNYTKIYEDELIRDDGSKMWLVNTNKLVRYYEGVDGLKTGYTAEAGYCITTTAMKNSIRYISVVMGSQTSELRSYDTTSLLDYGFNNYKLNIIYPQNTQLGNIKIEKGNLDYGTLIVKEDITELLKVTDKIVKYEKEIIITNNKAPLNYGDEVGLIKLIHEGEVIDEIPITIKENITKRSYLESMIKVLKELTGGKY